MTVNNKIQKVNKNNENCHWYILLYIWLSYNEHYIQQKIANNFIFLQPLVILQTTEDNLVKAIYGFTIASVECLFSKINIIKNYLWNSMGQERLSKISILNIERLRTRELNIK